jgi:hypothetical protein
MLYVLEVALVGKAKYLTIRETVSGYVRPTILEKVRLFLQGKVLIYRQAEKQLIAGRNEEGSHQVAFKYLGKYVLRISLGGATKVKLSEKLATMNGIVADCLQVVVYHVKSRGENTFLQEGIKGGRQPPQVFFHEGLNFTDQTFAHEHRKLPFPSPEQISLARCSISSVYIVKFREDGPFPVLFSRFFD